MGGLNYQEIKDLLVKHKLYHYNVFKASQHRNEKSYHFGAWRAIKDFEKEFIEKTKKKRGA